MAVTISASHLTRKDYEGIVKGVLQIPLWHFLPDPQANGSKESSVSPPGAATTQCDPPKASNSSKKSSSTSTSKSGSSTAHHSAAGTQLGGQGTPTPRGISRHPPAGPDAEPLQGKGPCQEPATTTAGPGKKGQEMREDLNTGVVIIVIMTPLLDPEDNPPRSKTNNLAQLITTVSSFLP